MCTPVPRVTTKKTIHKIKTINKSRWNLKKCSSDPHRKAKRETKACEPEKHIKQIIELHT